MKKYLIGLILFYSLTGSAQTVRQYLGVKGIIYNDTAITSPRTTLKYLTGYNTFGSFNDSARAAISLTTTGTSGAATYSGGVLNVPQYSGGGGTMAIGGAVTSATAGSVFYAGTGGILQQSNAGLFYDSTNKRLGIGTASPSDKLHVLSATHLRATFETVAGFVAGIMLKPAATTTGQWSIDARGTFDATNNRLGISYQGPGSNESLSILPTGSVGIGQVSPTAYLHIKAGTATASTAPIKLTSGVLLSAVEAGTMEFDGTHFYTSPGLTRLQLDGLTSGITGGQTIIGSTSTNSGLTYKTTTATGTTGADHIFQVGNNGATEAMRITNAGLVGVGTTSPIAGSFMTVGAGGVNSTQATIAINAGSTGISGTYYYQNGTVKALFGLSGGTDGLITGTVASDFAIRNSQGILMSVDGGSSAALRIKSTGSIVFPATNTATGTTGAQTINKASGKVNFAAGATTLVVSNSLVTSSSIVMVTVEGTDATAISARVTPTVNSFTITLNAAATAETKVAFWVIN